MEEHGWELPENLAELEALCGQIRGARLEPGCIGMQLTGVPFATVFNLAKTGWFSTLEGVNWERDFLAGSATAAGKWEDTMDYVQKYIDIGMFNADPEDHSGGSVLKNFAGTREAVFCTSMQALSKYYSWRSPTSCWPRPRTMRSRPSRSRRPPTRPRAFS